MPEKMMEHRDLAPSRCTQYRAKTTHCKSWFSEADRRALSPQGQYRVNLIHEVEPIIPTSNSQTLNMEP